jgi:predicted RNase H-like HicB family nuclease
MTTTRRLTTIIEREGNGYVAWCPALDIASQGDTVEAARANVQEAISLVLEVAPPEDVADRLKGEVFVTDVEVAFG